MNRPTVIASALLVLSTSSQSGEVKVVVERNDRQNARAAFAFPNVPAPARRDAGSKATFAIVDGQRDGNSADLDVLHDGRLPSGEDQPAANFFFAQQQDGGRLAIDLGSVIEIQRVNTYSWHPNTRGSQVYKLYAADATAAGFEAAPKRGTDPLKCGWVMLAAIDTRTEPGGPGGQYGVSITDTTGVLGKFRHLLFDVLATERDDAFGNTFYSEIDVVTANDPPPPPPVQPVVVRSKDGKYEITIDASQAPEIKDWADQKLTPVLLEWYPKIVAMLPSDGFEAPAKFSVVFQDPGRGVAATRGTRITCAVPWFLKNLEGEAIGAVVHELVHVVQQYGAARRANRDAKPAPGWLTEGIPDYIRWYLYEPQSHGADRVRSPSRASYDGSYRLTANFLHWVAGKHDKDIVRELNAALRAGKYTDELWQQRTGKPVVELGQAWKKELIANSPPEKPGAVGPTDGAIVTLTEAEKRDGWKLLFNGQDLSGWHSFKRTEVRPGWQVEDGVITCVDPHDAGDLCTNDQYGEFELVLDYCIAPGGNSGIMFHVTDAGGAAWATGPECQLLDNKEGKDPQRAGWLYGLYRTELDATRPPGQWNHLRLLITKEKCEHVMNGVKYFDYSLHSDDFAQRLAKSKFASMATFAKFDAGYIALQGDHGLISFRNIKIRPIEAKK